MAKTHAEYIEALAEPRRADVRALDETVRRAAPQLAPTMEFGMPGYGKYHYRYDSGREGDWALVLFASQKNHLSLYVTAMTADGTRYLAEAYADRLGKVSVGRSCIRFKRLSDVDGAVLAELLAEAAAHPPYPLAAQ
ncbi:DUF1801 domain-containing protein [Fodinicola acaciae]|uniref:DUF1801 domain-containing protein n=1 Tax=Fodinicola acaciae TaxID=2681555 RepID=UPI0013D148A9|nr:DUF1801 domain-containing protein [Fodinicola acaciae]